MAIDGSQRRQRLRLATQPSHARLDALIDDSGFLQHPARYLRYLEAIWVARGPAERALDACGAVSVYPAWPERSVSEALRQDIEDLSDDRPLEGSTWREASDPLSIGQVLGVLYVLEGSALGAHLLEQRVASIGMTAVFGARHMARQTAQPRAWPRFVEVLDQARLEPAEEDRCIAAAADTFQGFERAIQAVC